ncbi:c-type cytochrome [Undibacterium terreum]|uniref:Cytochrome c domain-containing protein n=1 Tax=Undibacterium terreum TaxID=1224302 RepID=A0A916USQ0_9BURK|nr:c-type cytochrome [Undibacterium terreum]GGC85158.1 hypothetical protein GCM10011396_35580 [Undibacterium terreum]
MNKLMLAACLLAIATQGFAASTSEQTCRACHTMDTKLVGPPFKEIAAAYKNDSDAITHLKKSMLEGSSGKWGSVPMPANAGLSAAEAEQFSHWIMSLNNASPAAGKEATKEGKR